MTSLGSATTANHEPPAGGFRPEPAATLARDLREARQRTLAFVADLTDEQLIGPHLPIVNPLLWEIGHTAWFYERWMLRHTLGRAPLFANGDALWDSMAVAHHARWDLPLPPRAETLAYMQEVEATVLEVLEMVPAGARELAPALAYHARYAIAHEDMHTEAFTYSRQTLGYPAPRVGESIGDGSAEGAWPGDAEIPGGTFWLGAPPTADFAFDNEKWAHPVAVAPFAIARAPVTQAEYAAFVEADGYARREFWSPDGWAWREANQATGPAYWKRDGAREWHCRHFDSWRPLLPHRPMIHVNGYEAEAYCGWAGRRLPTETEWEVAAAGVPDGSRRALVPEKRRYPWGNTAPAPEYANLDWQRGDTLEVAALPEGDSACGCRQMLGNVWEWTHTVFRPYPGFVADPYAAYSAPWFGDRWVMRGGAWATRGRSVWNTWRNYREPQRRDTFSGFRTCRRAS